MKIKIVIFVIEIESVLYSCESCQRYMQALKEYGTLHGKNINFTFKANSEAKEIKFVTKELNP